MLNRSRHWVKESGGRGFSYKFLYLVLAVAYLLNILTDWFWLRALGIRGGIDYGDLHIVLTAVDCFRSRGFEIYEITDGVCAYNYGQTFLHFFAALGVGAKHTWIIGPLLIAATVTCFIELLRKIRPAPSFLLLCVASACFLSPPVQLLFERGNLDSLVFIFLCLSVIVFANGWSRAAVVLITAAVTLKFYSLPALISSLLFLDKRKYSWFLYFCCLVFATYLTVVDLTHILGGFSVPNPMGAAFGSSSFGNVLDAYSRLEFSRVELVVIGFVIAAFLIVTIYFIDKRSTKLQPFRASLDFQNSSTTFAFWVFGTTFLATYFLTMNYDYRLVFLCPLICVLAVNSPGNAAPLIASGLMALWGSFNLERLPDPLLQQVFVGDIPLLVFCVFLTWALLVQLPNELASFLRGNKR